jgi:hypothetical protein
MKTKITFLIVSISLLITLFEGCSSQQKAKGQEDEIIVFADSADYRIVEPALKETFGKIIYTPQPEELFQLKRKKISELDKYKQQKNIIILGQLDSETDVSKYLNTILDDKVKTLVKSDSIFVINKHDLWAENQLVMVLTSTDLQKLKQKILNKKEDLLYYFRDVSNQRLAKGLYNRKFEQKKIEAHLLSKYGWMIYMQADYQVAMEKPEDNFVWLRRGVNTDMERWIFIHWIENASPIFLEKDSIEAERNRMTEKYYRTTDDSAYVELYDDYKINSEVNFNGKYALMTQGLWRFNDLSGGGPFISYAFYDEKTRRIYIIDASIFAPKYFKKSLLQQVDLLLHSFKTEREVDPVVKKDILEELKD